MSTFLVTGILTALGVFIILYKMNIRKVLNFQIPIDIAFTFGMVLYFSGTFAGIMTGVVAGITLSVLLLIATKIWGVEKIKLRRKK